jgi:hypothetical protein
VGTAHPTFPICKHDVAKNVVANGRGEPPHSPLVGCGDVREKNVAIRKERQAVFAVGFPLLHKNGILSVNLHWLYLAAIAQVLIMVGIVIVSLMTSPPAQEKWNALIWTPKLLWQYGQGQKMPWYKMLRLWYGIFAAIWIYLYICFW